MYEHGVEYMACNSAADKKGDAQQFQEILRAECKDPHKILGYHHIEEGDSKFTVVRCFVPDAKKVFFIDKKENKKIEMKEHESSGLFELKFRKKYDTLCYYYSITNKNNTKYDIEDPYSFLPTISDYDLYLFGEGKHYKIYNYLGAHLRNIDGIEGVSFAVWAPNAVRVSVVGDFNNWDGRRHQMRMLGSSGVWEIFIPRLREGEKYKFEIKAKNGDIFLKTDPFGFFFELKPKNAAIVWDIHKYKWKDRKWMKKREKKQYHTEAMSIYEVNLHSWDRKNLEEYGYKTYREYAEILVDYVKEMGYTHVEFMPVTEHPFDLSWGYQVTGYFAPTSRFGFPEDFMYLVDKFHQNNIGVIIDWVPAHFPKDAFALPWFDGSCLYEHEDPRKGEHKDWGTLIFNYGRNEVKNFLIASALFWFDKYHIDGVRVDAVSSMLYLDYSKKEGEWVANKYGGNENLEAIDFLKEFNIISHKYFSGIINVAEESTAWPNVSRPVELGGLGFGFKWNMGWMHDTLKYFSKDPIYRKYHHNELTFSMLYAYNENFILALSHDEVVYGKKSLLQKMPGDMWQKFANLRLLYAYQYCHPGKKLLFMGGEFGQINEWYIMEPLHWYLLDKGDKKHRQLRDFVKELNKIYRENPQLWEMDFSPEGFQWIDCHDSENSVISFIRRGLDKNRFLVCIFNFTPVVRTGYRIGLPAHGFYREILNSDSELWGGSNVGNCGGLYSEKVPCHGFENSLVLTLPPLAAIIFRYEEI